MAAMIEAWRDENNPPPADGAYLWFKGDIKQNPRAKVFIVKDGLILAERNNGKWTNLDPDCTVREDNGDIVIEWKGEPYHISDPMIERRQHGFSGQPLDA